MNAPDAVFTARVPHVGTLELTPVRAERDTSVLHEWFTDDHAAYWGMTTATRDDVYREYRRYETSTRHRALLGLRDGHPEFLLEYYDPASDPVGAVYAVRRGDVGMHFLAARTAVPIAGFTTAAMTACLTHLFDHADHTRVVVEPDVRNHKVHALNARVGFRADSRVDLPDKCALLSFCTREDFYRWRTAPTEGREEHR
ncbi:GNAT family N-acetyltransferase [Spelaeicoccus albus]|uniref:Lysine N-acyltransferase MbtK n=1 Tax=Spelaeicoccus albus TaxID=1280376 RepID=A0A7Z0D3J1_9MICO|nr:GNAT family N-acetyltransferase [Spelaeicoccus albus]NYI68218.1 RimJ/RimL family protein N-acetyltransferase [Spelaeicoccus albus]